MALAAYLQHTLRARPINLETSSARQFIVRITADMAAHRACACNGPPLLRSLSGSLKVSSLAMGLVEVGAITTPWLVMHWSRIITRLLDMPEFN
ncbi:hypothetical protein [Nitrosospira sp. Nsp2]|uniref:hypothetical protein n=1 Tax=Nitrosospira sp. Nsp2 TaxID=136548 RepID=UPI000D306A46|nr:hypothetical protein [Nitrosospira sp. Nsp2]